jgi:hypothetical protein
MIRRYVCDLFFEAGEPSQRRCGRYGETRHNLRTGKQDIEVNSE